MAAKIRGVDYYYVVVEDRPGEAYRLLAELASADVNMLAFNAIPMGPGRTQLMVFPESPYDLARVAERVGAVLTGPQRAFLIQGDDQLGALVDIHKRLYDSGINVSCASGVTDGRDGYGYVVYVKNDEWETAARALGL